MKTLITNSQHPFSGELTYLLNDNEIVFGDNYQLFPKPDSHSLTHEILKFCLDEQIEKVIPTQALELAALSVSEVLFREFDIELMLSKYSYNKPLDEVADFNELSSKLLKYGYPNKQLAIGRKDLSGNIFSIDDEIKTFEKVWTKVDSLSFLQLGKLFNQQNFNPLFIYEIGDEFNFFNFFVDKSEFKSLKVPDTKLKSAIESFAQSNQIEGFYQLYYDGNNLVRIKNAFT